jgi:hypothetical protein
LIKPKNEVVKFAREIAEWNFLGEISCNNAPQGRLSDVGISCTFR